MADEETASLLEKWGLAKYAQTFADHDVDVDVFAHLTEQHLQEMGVSLGDRLRLLELFRSHVEQSPAPSTTTPDIQGERRQMTVMFCDLVGSTSISEGMDPESYREIIVAYRQSASDVIRRFGGFIARHLGDGLLVYFGYPKAGEDDAARAIRAGLAIIVSIKGLPNVKGKPLQARVGIATGVVVVGEIIGEGFEREREVSGETPNLAARLQGLAEPNTVIVSPSTRSLAGALFEYESLGQQAIKGLSKAVPVWRVVADSGIVSRFEARRLQGALGQLVGRDEEMVLLRNRWQRASAGNGQIIMLQGEAGVGKSRLIEAIRSEIYAQSEVVNTVSCYGMLHYEHSAFYPILREVEVSAGIERANSTNIRMEKLRTLFMQRGANDPRLCGQLVADTLGFGNQESRNMSPRDHRLRILAMLEEQFVGAVDSTPSLIVFEDLQWFDASSLELLGRLVVRLTTLPTLVIVTFRSDFIPPWSDTPQTSRITVNRLSPAHCVELIEQLCRRRGLNEATVNEIVSKTDGIPLFVEEVTQTVLDRIRPDEADKSTVDRAANAWVPMSLHDSLMARLDGLSDAKEVAQIGAALGRNFSFELIEKTSDLNGVELRDALSSLVREGILNIRGDVPNVEYVFKHALVQETAYGSLLHSRRRTIHAKICTVLERHFPEILYRHPEVCAYHHSCAGAMRRAFELWQHAGQLAFERSANLESVSHFRAALAALDTIEDLSSLERNVRECRLQLNIGAALVAPKGYAAPEVHDAYARASELSGKTTDADMQFTALRGLWHNHALRGQLDDAKMLAGQLLASAENTGRTEHALVALRASGLTSLVCGELKDAQAKFEQGIVRYDPKDLSDLMRRYGEDPGLYCLLYSAWVYDWSGQRKLALQQTQQALSIAEQSGNHFAVAYVLALTAQLYQYRHESNKVLIYSQRAIDVADRYGMVQWAATANIARGWALADSGNTREGVDVLCSAIAHWRKIGAELIVPYFMGVQAEAHLLDEDYDSAERIIDEASVLIHSTGQRAWAAEVATLRAKLTTIKNPSSPTALDDWRQAQTIAAQQGANLFVLRATYGRAQWELNNMALSDETRMALNAVVHEFDTDCETPEVLAAKELINGL